MNLINNKIFKKYILLFVALVFIFLGIYREEHSIVLQKAIKICLECIGVG